jgi:hypothetical protein
MMAGDPDTALPLATEGLAAARRLAGPRMIGLNLAALAGALADRDPERAAALLHEDIEHWASRDYENAAEITNATLISARIRDWPTALELAPRAIRHLHWTGDRPQLGGILNILARVLAPNDPESAAIIQGAARRVATTAANEPVTSTPAPVAPGASTQVHPAHTSGNGGFLTELRRETTGVLAPALGDDACARCAQRARRWTPTQSLPMRSTRPHAEPPSSRLSPKPAGATPAIRPTV